jgi:hypothetical protein
MGLHCARAVALSAVVGALLAGCGGDDDSDTNQPYAKRTINDQQKVELVIADFYGASPRKICDSLSSGALEEVGGRQACLEGAAKPQATDYNVQSVRFDSNGEAIAVVRVGGKLLHFTLVDEDGEYKVSEPLPPGF